MNSELLFCGSFTATSIYGTVRLRLQSILGTPHLVRLPSVHFIFIKTQKSKIKSVNHDFQ